jgi:hypothetical protein
MRTLEEPSLKATSPVSRRRADTERLEAQLAEWTAIIAQYRAGAKRAGADRQRELDRIGDELQLLRNEAVVQIRFLKGTTDLDWEASVSALDRSWGAIRSTFQKADPRY